MTREIKFRAWDKYNKKYERKVGVVPEGWGIRFEGRRVIVPADANGYDRVIEQYTGLKDKNGKEIYEGDIVKFDIGDQTPAIVTYESGSYFMRAIDDGSFFYDPDLNKPCPLGWFFSGGLKIIGNIHENPELLEERER